MTNTARWTSADLELMPEDGKRYEISTENCMCPNNHIKRCAWRSASPV